MSRRYARPAPVHSRPAAFNFPHMPVLITCFTPVNAFNQMGIGFVTHDDFRRLKRLTASIVIIGSRTVANSDYAATSRETPQSNSDALFAQGLALTIAVPA